MAALLVDIRTRPVSPQDRSRLQSQQWEAAGPKLIRRIPLVIDLVSRGGNPPGELTVNRKVFSN
jgi:hypothetical protein